MHQEYKDNILFCILDFRCSQLMSLSHVVPCSAPLSKSRNAQTSNSKKDAENRFIAHNRAKHISIIAVLNAFEIV